MLCVRRGRGANLVAEHIVDVGDLAGSCVIEITHLYGRTPQAHCVEAIAGREPGKLDENVNPVGSDAFGELPIGPITGCMFDNVKCAFDVSRRGERLIAEYLEFASIVRDQDVAHHVAYRIGVHERTVVTDTNFFIRRGTARQRYGRATSKVAPCPCELVLGKRGICRQRALEHCLASDAVEHNVIGWAGVIPHFEGEIDLAASLVHMARDRIEIRVHQFR